jgi:hypothetical protein
MGTKNLKGILGKTITGVVYKTNRTPFAQPAAQLYLVLEGGTYYEIYSTADIAFTWGPDEGDQDKVTNLFSVDMKAEYRAWLDEDSKAQEDYPESG